MVSRDQAAVTPVPDLPLAACKGMDTALFIADDRSPVAVVSAQRVCEPCPEREACLEFALANPILRGIWGGTTAKERTRIRDRRARGDA